MTARFVIAIDGPGGVGKTTVCRALANTLGWAHLDTGAFYRAATVIAMLHRLDLANEADVMAVVADAELDYQAGRMFIAGIDMSHAIRSDVVADRVSRVAALAGVRMLLVGRQRDWVYAQTRGTVVEGRDIGTVVFPSAHIKVYLTADPEIRASRRAGQSSTRLESVRQNLARRDHLDSNRPVSPLTRAEDATEIDTSHLGVDQVVKAILDLVNRS